MLSHQSGLIFKIARFSSNRCISDVNRATDLSKANSSLRALNPVQRTYAPGWKRQFAGTGSRHPNSIWNSVLWRCQQCRRYRPQSAEVSWKVDGRNPISTAKLGRPRHRPDSLRSGPSDLARPHWLETRPLHPNRKSPLSAQNSYQINTQPRTRFGDLQKITGVRIRRTPKKMDDPEPNCRFVEFLLGRDPIYYICGKNRPFLIIFNYFGEM